jgi:hypothetical protein
MPELPHPWGAYLRCQEQLARHLNADDYAWGLESTMNRLLAGALGPEAVDRAVDNGGRKERHRAVLRRRRVIVEARPEPANLGDKIDAQRQVAELENLMCNSDWCILRELGEGYCYCEIAACRGMTEGAVRTRVCRLRGCFRARVARALGWPELATKRRGKM